MPKQPPFSDLYFSGMIHRFGFFYRKILSPTFEKVRTNPDEIARLKTLSETGTLVYVMKNRGQLEYSFFNHLFLKEGLPLARFANGSRTLFWRPLKEIIQGLLAKLNYRRQSGDLPNPITSGFLQECVSEGSSALLNLKTTHDFIFGANENPLSFIPPLIRAAEGSVSARPIYLVPLLFLHDRHPDKDKKSWLDSLFGEKSNPGTFRKLILFCMSYKKQASVKVGEALNLGELIKENPDASPIELAKKLKEILLTRLMIERRSITGPTLSPRNTLWHKIQESRSFQTSLMALAHEEKKNPEDFAKEAERYFFEIATDINYGYIDFYSHFVTYLTNTIYDGLHIDQEGLSRVKNIAGKKPIVLVPCHKSHVDYLLISHIFYNHDLTIPHVCAGINMKFWPVGTLLRKAGAFFIRRTFVGKKLYKIVLEHYVQELIREGFCLEFFIEGTRSRTGKLLKPKMGILSMIIEAYLEGAAPDICFVPISINYERILEAKSYLDEIKGGEKEKENMTGVLKASQKFKNKYGRVSVQFANPLSLKEFLDGKDIGPGQKLENIRNEISEFAYRITYNINKVSEVTSSALISLAMLTYPKKGIPEKEIFKRAHLFKNYLDFKQVRFSAVINQNEQWAYREALQKFTHEKTITAHNDFHEKFYTISEVSRALMDYHKNSTLHFFVSFVCFAKLCLHLLKNKASVTLAEVESHFEMIKTLLRHDFTFSERATLKEHLLKVISFCTQEHFINFDSAHEIITPNTQGDFGKLSSYLSLLDNFFESYLLTLLYIKHVAFEKMDKKKLISSILEKGKALHLKGDIQFPEALSRFNIENALMVFTDIGLIVVEEKNISRVFDENLIEKWEKNIRGLL